VAWATCVLPIGHSALYPGLESRTVVEFLLVFDDGDFDEKQHGSMSAIGFKHTPNEVLGKNFGARSAHCFGHTPDSSERYIFAAAVPGRSARTYPGATVVPQTFSHRLMAQEPIKTSSGTVRISDSRNFRSTPQPPRRWSRLIRVGCARCIGTPTPTLPFAMEHYIENTGTHAVALSGDVQEQLLRRFVAGHMAGADSAGIAAGASEARSQVVDALRMNKTPIVPG